MWSHHRLLGPLKSPPVSFFMLGGRRNWLGESLRRVWSFLLGGMKPQALRFHLLPRFASTRDPQNSFRALKRINLEMEKIYNPQIVTCHGPNYQKKNIKYHKISLKHLGAERREAFPEVTPSSYSPQGLPDTRDARSCTGPHVSRQAQNVEDEAENHDVHSEQAHV